MNLPHAPSTTLGDATTFESQAPALEAVDLGGDRGGRQLFRHLSFVLQPGQLVWLRGRNGRGKTSLLRLLAGLSTPAEGAVRVGGQAVARADGAWRQRLVFIAHANALKDDLSVLECLQFSARLQGRRAAPAELAAALGRMGMAALATRAVRTLSQGQRRRTVLARLALPQPRSIWLLDEPFDALDDDGVQRLNTLLAEHARQGGSALLTSHQALSLQAPAPTTLDLDVQTPLR
jgi:heme exporter protein A